MKFSEAITKFSAWRKFAVKETTVKGYEQILKVFCLFLRNPQIEDIRLDDVMEYLNGMRDLGWEENSFVTKCMALRKFFEFAKKLNLTNLDPELIPIQHKTFTFARVATEEDYKALVKYFNESFKKVKDLRYIRNELFIRLLWDTGARLTEILNLNISDIRANEATIRTLKSQNSSKNSRPIRQIFWSDETQKLMLYWLHQRSHLNASGKAIDTEALFISLTSWKAGQRLTKSGVGEALRRACKALSIPAVNAHSFRHHMGHQIIKKGGSTADVMNILGHATMESSKTYVQMQGIELRERYKFLVDKS